jgi:hypothetical protein
MINVEKLMVPFGSGFHENLSDWMESEARTGLESCWLR